MTEQEQARAKLYSLLTRYFSDLRTGRVKISDNATGVLDYLEANGYEVREKPINTGVPTPPVGVGEE